MRKTSIIDPAGRTTTDALCSRLSRLKITEEAREAVLAHARPGIKGTYNPRGSGKLSRCGRPFLTVPSCGCRVSITTGPGKLQVQPRPQCPRRRRPAVKMQTFWGAPNKPAAPVAPTRTACGLVAYNFPRQARSFPFRRSAVCIIAMSVEPREIGEAARFPLSHPIALNSF